MRRLVWVPFAVALLAFALPFATVSCDDARVEPSGADLLLRTAPESVGTNPAGIELGDLVVAYGGGLATAAFLAFALSLLAAVRGWRSGWAPLSGVAGVAALLFLRTRGGGNPGGIAEVDARLGGIIAAVGGGAGVVAAAAVWLRQKPRPSLLPLVPVLAASLLVFGYLFPADRSPVVTAAYADTLDLTRPWDGVFWLLPVVVGALLLAHRSDVSPSLAAFAVGVFAVAGADVGDEIWSLLREDNFQPGAGAIAFFAGIVTAGAWTVTREWLGLRRPAPLPLVAGVALALLAWLASPANG